MPGSKSIWKSAGGKHLGKCLLWGMCSLWERAILGKLAAFGLGVALPKWEKPLHRTI